MKTLYKQFGDIPLLCPPEYENRMRQEFESLRESFVCLFEGERCNRDQLCSVVERLWRCYRDQKDIGEEEG